MNLFRYQDFKLNENIASAKKVLKDTYALNKAICDVGEYKTDRTGLFLLDTQNFPVLYKDLPEDVISTASSKLREIKIKPEEITQIERHPKFVEIRNMLGDKLGWAGLFTYLLFKEGVPIEEEGGGGGLKAIYKDMCDYQDLLGKLRRPVSNYIDPKASNNAEQLIDDLEDIKRYRKLKKFIDEMGSDLKADYKNSQKFFKDKLMDIANSFDDLGRDEKTGKIDSEKQKMIQNRFYKKISRYKNIRELITKAEEFLKAEANADVAKFYTAIEVCNKKYGNYGVNVLYDEGGLLIMEIKSFPACKDLFGNTSWCIAQYLGQWNNYVGSENLYNKQYAIINFNLPPSDNKSIIGITIEPKQAVRACHLKNDANAISSFRGIFNEFETKLGLEKDFIWKGLVPMSDEEISEKKRRNAANRDLVQRDISLERMKKCIIEDGADVNTSNGAALDNAVQEDNIEKVKFLLDYGASPNLRSKQDATINKVKSWDVAKILIQKGAEITAHVFKSCIEDEDAVRFCLDNGLDPNFGENMPLRLAVKNGNLKLVKLLEEYGVSSENLRQMNTRHAAEYQRWDILDYFINKGGSYVEDFNSVFRWIGHTQKLTPQQKMDTLDRLQEYVDEGKVKLAQEGYRTSSNRNAKLEDVIKEFGSFKNFIISSNPELVKLQKK